MKPDAHSQVNELPLLRQIAFLSQSCKFSRQASTSKNYIGFEFIKFSSFQNCLTNMTNSTRKRWIWRNIGRICWTFASIRISGIGTKSDRIAIVVFFFQTFVHN